MDLGAFKNRAILLDSRSDTQISNNDNNNHKEGKLTANFTVHHFKQWKHYTEANK